MADLQDVIDNLKNEGALTRNKGTNSTKSVKEILIRNSEKQIAFQDSLITRLADSVRPTDAGPSPAEQKQDAEDEANADKKQNMFLQKIAAGIGGLFEMGKKGAKAAALGGLAILSTLAIGAFVIALGKFLQSDTFKDMTKFIQEEILPYLTEIGIAIASIVGVVAIAKFVAAANKVRQAFIAVQTFMKVTMLEKVKGMIGGVVGTFTKAALLIKNAFIAVQVFALETMLPAVKGMIGGALAKFASIAKKIKLAFLAVQTFMLGTMLPSITAFMTPLLPIIAAAAAVAFILYALYEAFQDFRKTLDETGSIGEAIKVAIGKFVGVLLGAIPALFLKLVAFVADLFGFKEFAKKVGDIDPIQFIADSVTGLFDQIGDFFGKMFDIDFGAIARKLIPDNKIGRFIAKQMGLEGGADPKPERKSKEEIVANIEALEKERVLIGGPRDSMGRHKAAERSAAMDAEIAKLKSEATAGLAKPMVLPKAKMSEAETLEAQRLSPSQYKQSGSIQEKMEKSKQQSELARQQTAAPVVVNTDARQTSNVNTTGPSGNNRIQNERYGGLAGSAYAFEGF